MANSEFLKKIKLVATSTLSCLADDGEYDDIKNLLNFFAPKGNESPTYIHSLNHQRPTNIGKGLSHLIIDPEGKLEPFILSDVVSWKSHEDAERYCKENGGDLPSMEQLEALSRAITLTNGVIFNPNLLPGNYEGLFLGYSQLWGQIVREGKYSPLVSVFNGSTGEVEITNKLKFYPRTLWSDPYLVHTTKSVRCVQKL